MGSAGSTNSRAEKFLNESEYMLICIQSDVSEATTNQNEAHLHLLINEMKSATHRLNRFLKCKRLDENTKQRCEALLFKYELILSQIYSLNSHKSSETSEDNNRISEAYEGPEYVCMKNTNTEPIYANTEDNEMDSITYNIIEDFPKLPLPRPGNTFNDSCEYKSFEEIDDIYEVPRDLASVSKLPHLTIPNDIYNNGEVDEARNGNHRMSLQATSSNNNEAEGLPRCLSMLDDILYKVDKINTNVEICPPPLNMDTTKINFPSYVDEIKYFWYNKNANGNDESHNNDLDEVYAIPRRLSVINDTPKEVSKDNKNNPCRPPSDHIEKEGVIANEFSKYYTDFNEMWETTYIEIDEAKEMLNEHVMNISESHLPNKNDDDRLAITTELQDIRENETIYVNRAEIEDIQQVEEKINDPPLPTPKDKEVIVNEIPKYFTKLNDILDKGDVNFDDAKEAFHIKKKCNEARSIFNKKVMQIVRKSEEQIVYAK